jgi:hypothetical protein
VKLHKEKRIEKAPRKGFERRLATCKQSAKDKYIEGKDDLYR